MLEKYKIKGDFGTDPFGPFKDYARKNEELKIRFKLFTSLEVLK